MLTSSKYQIDATLHEGVETIIYRAQTPTDGHVTILKILKAEYPTLEAITRLKHEYQIRQNLDSEQIVKAICIETFDHRIGLVLEDFGGESLTKLLETEKLSLQTNLNIAIQIVKSLQYLHLQNIIHKDIKPSNIIINSQTKQVKLTDFGIATKLNKENPQFNNPNSVEGTLAYMSPEQTGRMNRTLDYRTDFYSLGITLYEMLTGKLPFPSNDPLEIVYSHIAVQAISPHQINSEIPAAISDIVMKLLAKNAEDRYQTAEGIKADLEKCLNYWQTTGEIAYFVPGKFDRSPQLSIPQKLYGREAEVDRLLAAFERVSGLADAQPPENAKNLVGRAHSEIVLVSGYSGIGKTAIVNEVHKPIVRQRGYFINGKFDQFKRNIPYAALIQAFQSLIGQLLTESSEKLQAWREKLAAALSANGAVIVDVIPEIELIIGKQPEVPQLGPAESQNRFNRVFQEFINVFTRAEHPLVIFLDDLQWADSASLNLMQLLVGNSESQYLLLIGAYRDNEVHPTHPLVQAIEQIAKTGTPVNNIVLQPLDFGNVYELIADTLTANDKMQLLAELIFNKTGGNPFFITQLLQALYQENLLHFEFSSGSWQWSLEEIQAIGITDKSVVELVASRIEKLPDTTQRVLKLAACIGDKFTLDVLSIVSEKSQAQAASELWAALQTGLVLPLSNAYKIPLVGGWGSDNLRSILPASQSKIAYKFLHDRVQQAAYSLIPDGEKQATHLKIGQLLLENTPASEIEDNVFDIVNQLNVGVEFLAGKAEKDELAKLNLIAGKKAKASNAYEAAVRYLNVSLELINSPQSPVSMQLSWATDYDLTLNLHVEAAEAEYLNTNFGRSQELADIVLLQATNLLDKVKGYELQIQSYISQKQLLQALDTGLQALGILGISLSEIPPEGLGGIKLPSLDELNQIPVITDGYQLAIIRILAMLISPIYIAKSELLPQIIFSMIIFSTARGNSALGAIAYSWYGVLLTAALGEIDAGYHSGQLALKLLDQFNAKELKCNVNNTFNALIRHWKDHARETILPLIDAMQSGLETGDIQYSVYASYNCLIGLLFIGEPLNTVEKKQLQYFNLAQQLKQELPKDLIEIWGQLLLRLQNKSANKLQVADEHLNETEILPRLQRTNNTMGIFNFYCAKMVSHYFFKEPQQAVANASLAAGYAQAVMGFMIVGTHNFYYSLALLAAYPTADSAEKEKHLMQVAANQERMQKWAYHAPMNYQHKYDLIEAETARVLGKNWEAADYYDKAIQGAKEQGYIQEAALANELAAEFYFSFNKDKIALVYLTESYYGYIHWGAIAKVKDLEARYPQLVAQTLNRETKTRDLTVTTTATTTSRDFSKSLDIGTFIKASQAITSEIVFDKLLTKLIKILLENAAAQKVALLLLKNDVLCIEATGSSLEDKVTLLPSIPVENCQDVPLSAINYVHRSQKHLVLDNATVAEPFNADAYIRKCQPKSILCLPIIYQSQRRGIIYLENALTVGAFTDERVEVLKVLVSQVAIAVENAGLYAREQEKSQQLEKSFNELQEAQLQLIQSEKMSALGNLIAGVAHEINNPLGFIAGNVDAAAEASADLIDYLQLYQEKFPNPGDELVDKASDIDLEYLMEDLPKMLLSMKSGTDRIRNISTSLRTFSRADTANKVSANIHDGIDSTLLILQYRLKANDSRPAIQVIREYGYLPPVKCYFGQLNQVFMNLLANAIDCFDEFNVGRTYAEVEALPNTIAIITHVSPDNNSVVITFKDNGAGMSTEVRAKIFDHLFTTKGVGKGTGLGLSISRQIVEETHGGKLSCDSVVGEGTEFAIELPLN